KIVLECRPSLVPLLSHLPVQQFIARRRELPPFDVYAPLPSLPGILRISETIPASVPYLFASTALIAAWREKLHELAGFKIGIAWQGNPAYRDDRDRSIRLECFARLAQNAALSLISLQKGPGSEQLSEIGGRFPVFAPGGELDENVGTFMD